METQLKNYWLVYIHSAVWRWTHQAGRCFFHNKSIARTIISALYPRSNFARSKPSWHFLNVNFIRAEFSISASFLFSKTKKKEMIRMPMKYFLNRDQFDMAVRLNCTEVISIVKCAIRTLNFSRIDDLFFFFGEKLEPHRDYRRKSASQSSGKRRAGEEKKRPRNQG